jgi:hypothetical protein
VVRARELRIPSGRRIIAWQRQARQALPNATFGQQAEYANDLARKAGYRLQLTAEQMQAAGPKQPRRPPQPKNRTEPGLPELVQLARLAQTHGSIDELLAWVRAVEELARVAGGLANLHSGLERLAQLQVGAARSAADPVSRRNGQVQVATFVGGSDTGDPAK